MLDSMNQVLGVKQVALIVGKGQQTRGTMIGKVDEDVIVGARLERFPRAVARHVHAREDRKEAPPVHLSSCVEIENRSRARYEVRF